MEKNVLCVKNRDARQQYLAQMLLEDGCQVTLCEEKCRELGEYELVLLPVVTAKLDLKQMIFQLALQQPKLRIKDSVFLAVISRSFFRMPAWKKA